MTVATSDLQEIARSVFAATLGWEVVVRNGPETPLDGRQGVFAAVGIFGAWHGTVRLGLPLDLACKVAGSMYRLAPEDAAPSAVRDAVGELVNMIGGNLKSLLPGPCGLTLPVVELGPELIEPARSDEVVSRVDLEWEAHSATLTLLRQPGEQPASLRETRPSDARP
jgi:chemotaxis protein CheX